MNEWCVAGTFVVWTARYTFLSWFHFRRWIRGLRRIGKGKHGRNTRHTRIKDRRFSRKLKIQRICSNAERQTEVSLLSPRSFSPSVSKRVCTLFVTIFFPRVFFRLKKQHWKMSSNPFFRSLFSSFLPFCFRLKLGRFFKSILSHLHLFFSLFSPFYTWKV